jgi:flagellar M-ring protein FliF
VASAVKGLKPQRVSIVDETGQLLADGAAGDSASDAAQGDERRANFEKRMRSQVEGIVSSVVGLGRARVQLSADFDYNKVTQTSDRYDPEGRVLRSSQNREETSASGAGGDGQVSVGNELPGAAGGARTDAAPNTPRDQSKKTEETNNYEISRTTKTEVTEAGRVNRISVAVLVDGIYGKNEKGETVYQDRPKEQIDRIAQLVRSAIGFDQKRGDQVEVVNLRFADAPQPVPIAEPTGLASLLQFTKDDLMYGIEMGVMLLLGLVVMFMVVRPLVRRVLASDGTTPALGNAGGAGAPGTPGAPNTIVYQQQPGTTTIVQQQGPGGTTLVAGVPHQMVPGQPQLPPPPPVSRIGEIAERNPSETASIIRQWLNEPA